jgi:hypothetical protein
VEFRRHWIPVAVISAVFLLPIVLELALHWPGNFGKYFSYGKSSQAGGHGPAQILHYMLWFWWPHPYAWVAAAALFGVAAGAAWLARDRFLLALLALNLASTAVVTLYAAAGIDDLSQYYIAYFYWSAPAITVLVIVLAVLRGLPVLAGWPWLVLPPSPPRPSSPSCPAPVPPAPTTSTTPSRARLPPWPRGRRAR